MKSGLTSPEPPIHPLVAVKNAVGLLSNLSIITTESALVTDVRVIAIVTATKRSMKIIVLYVMEKSLVKKRGLVVGEESGA